jgi:uncharacterized protein (DUF2267 family)
MKNVVMPDYFLALVREKTNALTLEESAEQAQAVLRGLWLSLPASQRDRVFWQLPEYCKQPSRQVFYRSRPNYPAEFDIAIYAKTVSVYYRHASTSQVKSYVAGVLHACKTTMEPAQFQLLLDSLPTSLRDRVLL